MDPQNDVWGFTPQDREALGALREALENITADVKEIKDHVAATNGRVTDLEVDVQRRNAIFESCGGVSGVAEQARWIKSVRKIGGTLLTILVPASIAGMVGMVEWFLQHYNLNMIQR